MSSTWLLFTLLIPVEAVRVDLVFHTLLLHFSLVYVNLMLIHLSVNLRPWKEEEEDQKVYAFFITSTQSMLQTNAKDYLTC